MASVFIGLFYRAVFTELKIQCLLTLLCLMGGKTLACGKALAVLDVPDWVDVEGKASAVLLPGLNSPCRL